VKIRIKSVEGIPVKLYDWQFAPEFSIMRHTPTGTNFKIEYDPISPSEGSCSGGGRHRPLSSMWVEAADEALGRMALAAHHELWNTAEIRIVTTPRPHSVPKVN
jgi:hypothetical protein